MLLGTSKVSKYAVNETTIVTSVAPIGPHNSYEVVCGFSSDFLSTAVEEAIRGGGRAVTR